jgi:hypothetical protein
VDEVVAAGHRELDHGPGLGVVDRRADADRVAAAHELLVEAELEGLEEEADVDALLGARGGRVPEREDHRAARVGAQLDALAEAVRQRGGAARGARAARDAAEELLHLGPHLGGVDGARDDERRPVGGVVTLEEPPHLLDADRAERGLVLGGVDAGELPEVEGVLDGAVERDAAGLLVVEAVLGEDGRALALQGVGVEAVRGEGHALALEPEGAREGAGPGRARSSASRGSPSRSCR